MMSIDIEENKSAIKSRYRSEIDGLRAFAVVTVIINHFNKDILPGGYLGVDIFFVISGFVITSSLYQRPSKNFKDFISGFYERRIKRLVPALSVFVFITSIAICLFNPIPNVSLQTGLTSLFGLSNIYLFQRSTDYFAQSTELNVFTHTWSLGVEEQFYILFPFLIWFSGFSRQTKNGSRNLFLTVGALTIASLIGFLYLYPIKQSAAYFLMPSRFWEIASGCLLFIGFQKRKSIEYLLAKIPPLMVLALIVGVMYLPMSWAAASTVAVVALSSVLIASLRKQTTAFTFFTNPKVVYIGLISYSLYLWHWGVLSISRWTIGIHWWSVPFQIVLMFGLANASYLWIETPLRKGNWFGKRWKTLMIGGGLLVTLSAGLVALSKPLKGKLYSGEDFTNTITKPLEFKGDITGRIAKDCHSSDSKENDALVGANKITTQFIDNCLSAKSERPLVAFSGDSHSLAIFPISEVIASTSQYDVFSHSRDGCAFPPQGETNRKYCYEVQSSIIKTMIDKMKRRSSGSVLVATSYLNSHFGYGGKHRFQIKKYSERSRNTVDKNLSDFINTSKKLASKLNDANASLILVAPLPQHPGFNAELCSPQWFRPSIRIICQKTDKDFLQKQRKHILEAMNALAMEVSNIYIFDPFDKFCDKKNCYVVKENTYLYSDSDHLSKEGAIMISTDLLSMIVHINSSKGHSNKNQ
ncbi:acyltransferase family protein [Prochlorococcus marinus]|uniref:Predicted acyltransferase n=1 Tax=Prochlorococcus marinus (strain MIT 9211) TaxID=93059 RepID=A9B9J6_PROM4|nr:acyltransferase family protein [Prochlorococcus marinus]ABX07971.1 Predicted acyltransferase [Prochlorococcus marinus str. MIT 9211]